MTLFASARQVVIEQMMVAVRSVLCVLLDGEHHLPAPPLVTLYAFLVREEAIVMWTLIVKVARVVRNVWLMKSLLRSVHRNEIRTASVSRKFLSNPHVAAIDRHHWLLILTSFLTRVGVLDSMQGVQSS